jgi:hypothetical protein
MFSANCAWAFLNYVALFTCRHNPAAIPVTFVGDTNTSSLPQNNRFASFGKASNNMPMHD